MDSKAKAWLEWGFRLLSLLIIPLVGWIISMEVRITELNGVNDVQNEKIARLESDVQVLNGKVKEIEENKRVLVRLETELKNANKTLDRIEAAISKLDDD